MTYNCDITPKEGKYFVQFPDIPNAITLGSTKEDALFMAGDVLNGILASHLDNGYPISEPKYTDGYPVEVSPKVAFAIELRKARANHTQKEVAETLDSLGASYNAFTSNNAVEYFVKCASDSIEQALDVLADMMMNAKFDSEELEKEK